MTDAELARSTALLRVQWDRLRSWVGTLDDPADPRPSVLEGMSVADLVAHVGRGLGALTAATPAEPGVRPLSIGDYVASYPANAQEIVDGTRELSAEIAGDPLRGIDALATAAFARLDELGPHDVVLRARRGPILLSDLVTTRLLELVVHADDLARSLPGTKAPIDRESLDHVAQALLDVVASRGGWSLELADPLTWVRLACGRRPYDVDVLAEALHPAYTSDSVPDLGRMLPLL